MRSLCRLLAILSLIFGAAGAGAQGSILVAGDDRSALALYPGLDLGTHINRLGVTVRGHSGIDLGSLSLRGTILVADKFAADYLALDSPSNILSFGAGLAAGLGRHIGPPPPWADLAVTRTAELRYEWLSYADAWGTSQRNGRVSLVFAWPQVSFGLAVQNDVFGQLYHDEWRTAAAEASIGFKLAGLDSAASLGVKIWTGSNAGATRLHRGETYAMNPDLPGYGLSTGILYAGLRVGAFGLQAGWDSESIRDLFQNGLHWLIDEGSVPLVEREARFYLALSIYPDGDLY